MNISGASITGIGDFRDAVLQYFDWDARSTGAQAHVRPTLELVVTETPAHLSRVRDAETGLNLIAL